MVKRSGPLRSVDIWVTRAGCSGADGVGVDNEKVPVMSHVADRGGYSSGVSRDGG